MAPGVPSPVARTRSTPVIAWIVLVAALLLTAVASSLSERNEQVRVLGGGLVTSLLLFGLVRTQSSSERRALALAKDMTSQMREREARLRAIVDSEPECVKTVSPDGLLLEMNPAGLSMIEADQAQDVIGRPVVDLVHPDDREAYQGLHDRVCEGESGALAFRVVGLRGALREMETTSVPLRDASGGITSVLSVTRDVTERKRADELLLQAKAQLEAVFRAVPDLFFVVGQDGTIDDYRGGTADDLHVPVTEFIGRRFLEILPPAVGGQLEEGFARVRATGRPVAVEYTLGTPSGEKVFEARLLPFASTQFVVVARDITERKRAEEALQRSEERYRGIVETANEGIGTMDAEGRITFANPRMSEILGYPPEELVGRSMFDFIDEASRGIVAEKVALGREGMAAQLILGFRRKDGQLLWALVSAQPIFDHAGRYAGALGMVTDVTERREAEEAYRRTQSLMSSIVEHSPNMVFVKDARDLRFVLFNKAGEELLGYRRDEMIGKHDRDFFPPDEANSFIAKDREVLAGGRMVEVAEEPIQTRSKGLRYLRTLKVPILDAEGRPQYLLGMSEDITDRKRLEGQLRQSQKLEAIGTLAGGIAHDFNNILSCIIGFSELARMDAAGNAHAVENVDNVLEAGRRAKGLVEQMMAFSRQQELVRQPLEPGPAVTTTLRFLRAVLPASVQIEGDIAPDLPLVLADTTQIHQLIMNLATNGAQAMPEQGGRLEIVADQVQITEAMAVTQAEPSPGRYVRLLVRDNGFGMDAATVERIFEPFFTTRQNEHNTGLGLSVVHGIVKNHGGAIVVHSQPGRGSTFEVYLPVYEGPMPEAYVGAVPVPRGQGERILFIDDEAQLAQLGRRMLEGLGYEVTALTDPVEAVTEFRARPDRFDLVVTDLTMPRLSGAQLARELLQIRPGVPILLNTGFGGRVTPEVASEIGLRGLLSKPNTIGSLGRAVHSALATSSR